MFRILLLIVCLTKSLCQGSVSFVNTESFQNLSRTKRQFEDHCFLPDHPANGEFKILGQEQEPYLPNSSVILNTIVDLSCKNGYIPETGGLARSICYQGKWKPNFLTVGRCNKKCPPVKPETETMYATCRRRDRKINCENSMDGTVIEVACKPFYETLRETIIRCMDGSWDVPITPCQQVCGKKGVDVQPLIIGGVAAVKTEYPWVAAVYKSDNNDFFGGGTIISANLVVSAAHIFSDALSGNLFDKNDYIIAAGKYYRPFGDERDIHKQTARIKQIYVPDSYKAHFQNFANDFALLTLEDAFAFTQYVQPICIDRSNLQDSPDLKEDDKAIITGWGHTQKNGGLSDELNVLTVRIQSRQTCSVPESFEKKFYTYDKICAGTKDGSVCAGDSGGGLFFRHPNTSRFYIKGILSVAPREHDGCNTNTSALYTDITPYVPIILKELNRRA